MRSLTRLGVAAAATAIASATALAGAGVAGAQDVDPVFNSPSSVSVSGKGEATEVTYTNRSERDLLCTAFAGPDRLIADFYDYTKKTGDTAGVELPTELNLRMLTALTTGKLGMYMGVVEDGQNAVLPSAFDLPGLELPDGAVGLTDESFAPAAIALCMNPDGGTYMEVEISAGAGVPAGLGSLDSALAGIGSSGSVAETTGSLGS
ncbi:hypothetical protein GQF49_06680 [Microbacter sp. ANSKLAB05]|nr:hypothetical protein [Microbacter sp. ANSKLAB05]